MTSTIRDEHIEAAVAQGILTSEQANRLRELARAATTYEVQSDLSVDPDDERFRLIGGFNDVFVTIGVLLLLSALIALANAFGFKLGFTVIAMAAAWGLSEIFARRMRLALPSIVLALMFGWAGAYAALDVGALVLSINIAESGLGKEDARGIIFVLFGLGGIISAALHEWRFRVPIDAAIVAAGVMCAIYGAAVMVAPNWTPENRSLLFALFGVGAFLAAVRIDASDPQRLTRRSDMAFWLHLLAAPMIVHAVIPFFGGATEIPGVGQAIAVLLVFTVLGLIALVIDRRALLVAGLSYAGFAIAYLLSKSVAEGMSLSLTLLGLAVLVLGLSVGWRSLRRAILPVLPLGRYRQYIPSAS